MNALTVGAADGVRLRYDEAGAGQAVVFVHAALGDRRMWEHQFRALPGTHRVVRFDGRGHGESEAGSGPFARYEDVLGLLDALGIENAVLVGSSMGAAQAVEVALAAPERVRGLMLICPGLSDFAFPPELAAEIGAKVAQLIPAERLAAYLAGTADEVDPAHARAMAEINVRQLVVGPGRTRDALAPEVWQSAIDMCAAVYAREWSRPPAEERFLEPAASGRLAEIKVPTLVVKGLSDEPALAAVADRIAEGIPGARLLAMPDTGHLPPVERPEKTTAVLESFLRDLS